MNSGTLGCRTTNWRGTTIDNAKPGMQTAGGKSTTRDGTTNTVAGWRSSSNATSTTANASSNSFTRSRFAWVYDNSEPAYPDVYWNGHANYAAATAVHASPQVERSAQVHGKPIQVTEIIGDSMNQQMVVLEAGKGNLLGQLPLNKHYKKLIFHTRHFN